MNSPLAANPAPLEALRAIGIVKRYGGVTALDGVDLAVDQGEIFGIIGPNGAGKSTLFDILCGITKPTEGSVEVLGLDVVALPPHTIARSGVGRTFQRTALFPDATVMENLLFARSPQFNHTVAGRILRSASWREDQQGFDDRASEVLALAGLEKDAKRPAGTLAYGVQRRLSVGMTLMSEPRILFLDEPAAGMNEQETAEFISLIRKIAPGRTIVIVEHDMTVIRQLCARALVVVDGRRVAVDTPSEVLRHPEVVTAYLGTDDE